MKNVVKWEFTLRKVSDINLKFSWQRSPGKTFWCVLLNYVAVIMKIIFDLLVGYFIVLLYLFFIFWDNQRVKFMAYTCLRLIFWNLAGCVCSIAEWYTINFACNCLETIFINSIWVCSKKCCFWLYTGIL